MAKTFTFVKIVALAGLLGSAVSCNQPSANSTTSTTPMTMATDNESMATDNTTNANVQSSDFYDFTMTSLDGEEIDFSKYKGKKVLLVNTASECGFTPQYKDLQELQEKHGDDVVILGFPANNFGGQEPGSNKEIATFCEKNYGVEFQMFEKISVKGDDKAPLYAWLQQNAPNHEEPSWNFCKYLVDEKGRVVAFYPSKVNPMGEEILAAISK
ncbi:glutathione peroxidase [Pontibacter sp. 172403-2]|uniref:glutathione peroxidase n=1 Tax=Pontibacter rufus TaxID=2791028 RepID=UPI001E63BDB1|nr:glutathione peroxidase [Pontibacter sp. 172403-2]